MTRLATIPSDLCFVTTLAQGLWQRAGEDPLKLAEMTVYLPTRRACRHLREAFLRVTGARAALLPRMQPLGDIDEVDLDFAGAGALDDVPPAIAPLRRQMVLAKLVHQKDKKMPLYQATVLAAALGQLLDQVQTEGCDFADLEKLVQGQDVLSAYWKETLQFLEIVMQHWPAILRGEGCIDPAARRHLVLQAQAEQWRASPPTTPIIVAGSTGSIPAVGQLMAVIATLPQGEVILPGLDLLLDERAWQSVGETHPQYTMKKWLETSGFKRDVVALWEGSTSQNLPRLRLLQESMRPAEVTDTWRLLSPEDVPLGAAQHLERLELDHPREEADVISLRLRAALEVDGQTAALVTPDRLLAARVAASLARWGIMANDSAGTSLHLWPTGSFLVDVLKAATPFAPPVAYLALLKHPLAAGGVEPLRCRHLARLAEMQVWRGVRRAESWCGAANSVREKEPTLAKWLDGIAERFAPFTENWDKPAPLGTWIDRHLALAESLAASPSEDGGNRLWRGEAGEAAVNWLDDWRQAAADFVPVTGADYAGLFENLMRQITVRPAYGQHPRLSLLGPLEARLLHHDLVILGGLNEGTWPPAAAVDPWMSRPMKRAFGLPVPERRVGQSAHDFVQLCAARHVLITRARRAFGTPTVPSRFLLQLETVLRAASHQTEEIDVLKPVQPWRAWARLLDTPDGSVQHMMPPSPCPPVEARPKKLSVTEISTWIQNPYAIYAKHILKLRKLDPIDAEVSAAEYGTVIHEALEKFVKQTLTAWPTAPLDLLLQEGQRAFADFADRPQVMAFWWPRFELIAKWFVTAEQERRENGVKPLLVEDEGRLVLQGGAFTLTGRADRIDLLPDGCAVIIDYKTGVAPSVTRVMAGYEPQLPLLALIAAEGGFQKLGAKQAGEMSYWQLQEKDDSKKIASFTNEIEAQIAKAREGLENLLVAYADEATPYQAEPKPYLSPRFNDYAHLSRLAEWGRVREGEE